MAFSWCLTLKPQPCLQDLSLSDFLGVPCWVFLTCFNLFFNRFYSERCVFPILFTLKLLGSLEQCCRGVFCSNLGSFWCLRLCVGGKGDGGEAIAAGVCRLRVLSLQHQDHHTLFSFQKATCFCCKSLHGHRTPAWTLPRGKEFARLDAANTTSLGLNVSKFNGINVNRFGVRLVFPPEIFWA